MKNIAEAFSYQFKQKGWVGTMLMGSLFVFLTIFVIPIPFLIGYMIRNLRFVMKKEKEAMPHWNHIWQMWLEGFKFMLASLGYLAPIFLVIIIFMLLGFLMAYLNDSDLVALPILLMLILQLCMFLYSLAMAFIFPVLYIKVANKEPYRNLYHCKEVWAFIKNNIGNLVIVILLSWAAGLIVNVGMLFFLIGIFPAAFYVSTIMANLYGQLYLESKKK